MGLLPGKGVGRCVRGSRWRRRWQERLAHWTGYKIHWHDASVARHAAHSTLQILGTLQLDKTRLVGSPKVPSYSVPRKFGSHPGRRTPVWRWWWVGCAFPVSGRRFLHGPSHSKRSRSPDHETQAKHPAAARPLLPHHNAIRPSTHPTRADRPFHEHGDHPLVARKGVASGQPPLSRPDTHTTGCRSHFTLSRGTPRLTVDLERAPGLRGAFQRTPCRRGPLTTQTLLPSAGRDRPVLFPQVSFQMFAFSQSGIASYRPIQEIHNKQIPVLAA